MFPFILGKAFSPSTIRGNRRASSRLRSRNTNRACTWSLLLEVVCCFVSGSVFSFHHSLFSSSDFYSRLALNGSGVSLAQLRKRSRSTLARSLVQRLFSTTLLRVTSPSSTLRTSVPDTRVASPGPNLHAISAALASQCLARSRSPPQQQSTNKIAPLLGAARVTTFARAEEHRAQSVDDRIGHQRQPP